MISESTSVESVLEIILARIEIEEQEENGHAIKRELSLLNDTRNLQQLNDEIYCRICYDCSQHLPIIHPCKCKGTMGAIHLKCLERWLEESNRNSCELCGHQFVVQRTLRYRVLQSIMIWISLTQQQHQMNVRSLKADLLRSIFITPVAIGCTYLCIVAADFYAKNNQNSFPPARWTSYLLLAMMSLLLITYFIWMYMAIQYHQRVWFYWWQKMNTVKVILYPENVV